MSVSSAEVGRYTRVIGELCSYTSTSKSGDFTYKSSSDSSYRAATATGFIGNIDFGTTNNANLVEFKSSTMTMDK